MDTIRTDDGGRERVLLFSDAVFGIAITLLAIDIRAPEVSRDDLTQALLDQWPKQLLGYAVAFFAVGSYWYVHHATFRFIRRAHAPLAFLNLVPLLFVALLPATSNLFDRYPSSPLALVLSGLNIALVGLGLWVIWWYAAVHGLFSSDADPPLISFYGRRFIFLPLAFVASVPVAVVAPRFVPLVWLLAVLLIERWVRRGLAHQRRELGPVGLATACPKELNG